MAPGSYAPERQPAALQYVPERQPPAGFRGPQLSGLVKVHVM